MWTKQNSPGTTSLVIFRPLPE
ncbi:hypothetical protein CEXT_27391, partial [Caerostris extrusa]